MLNNSGSGTTAGANAGNSSPARVTEALTVAATDRTDARPSWSNYGTVVDLFAPGVELTSDWRTSQTASYTGSGTSFSSPHVAGAAALYLAAHPGAAPSAAIAAAATAGVVKSLDRARRAGCSTPPPYPADPGQDQTGSTRRTRAGPDGRALAA